MSVGTVGVENGMRFLKEDDVRIRISQCLPHCLQFIGAVEAFCVQCIQSDHGNGTTLTA